jgi:8-oxo-dGTP pyrophosphatase MutT (NUDIX family)
MDIPADRRTFEGGYLATALPRRQDAAAIIHTEDGRYLMQLRDDKPGLRAPGHWGLFGGGIEPGENPREALVRELEEELDFTAVNALWFAETIVTVPQFNVEPTHKIFFSVLIAEADIAGMRQHEGAGMALMTVEEILAKPKVVPWDIDPVIMHARLPQVVPEAAVAFRAERELVHD